MSIIAMQSVIARLCIDVQFRKSFLMQSKETIEQFGLTAEELNYFKELDMEAVEDYANSLVHKKSATIKKWLPSSFSYLERLLSPRTVWRLLHGYSVKTIRDTDDLGGDWVRSEIPRLCLYLYELVESGEIQSPYLTGLVEFEAFLSTMDLDSELSRIASGFSKLGKDAEIVFRQETKGDFVPVLNKNARLRSFNFDVASLIECIEKEEPLPDLEEAITWILFFKGPRSNKTEAHKINVPLKELLELCVGEMSLREIISIIVPKYAEESGSAVAELEDDCLQILEQFYSYGVVSVAKKERLKFGEAV